MPVFGNMPVFQVSCIDDREDVLYGESYRNRGHRNSEGWGRTNYRGGGQRYSGLPTMKLIRNKNQSERKILLMHMDTKANA